VRSVSAIRLPPTDSTGLQSERNQRAVLLTGNQSSARCMQLVTMSSSNVFRPPGSCLTLLLMTNKKAPSSQSC
jgi:hypothetical protein